MTSFASKVVLGFGLFGSQHAQEMLDMARSAREAGYSHCWVADSQNLFRESYTLLGALSQHEPTLHLGTGVTNASTRHLSVLASSWVTLSELAGRPVSVGIGTGDSSLRTLGLEPLKLAQLEHTVSSLRSLFAGDAVADPTTGVEYRLNWAPPTKLPIYIAASGPRILELSGRIADGVILLAGAHPDFIQASLDRIEAGAVAAGRTLADIDIVLWMPVALEANATAAADLVRSHVARIVVRPLPSPIDPDVMKSVEQIRSTYDYDHHLSTDAAHGELVSDELVRHFAISGDRAGCAAQLAAIAHLNFDQLALVPYAAQPTDRSRVLTEMAHVTKEVVA